MSCDKLTLRFFDFANKILTVKYRSFILFSYQSTLVTYQENSFMMLRLSQKLLLLGLLGVVATQDGVTYNEINDGSHEIDPTVRVVLSLIICVVGLIGNFIAIFVILVLKEYKKSATHWYVLQLAVADSLFLLTLPFKVSELLEGYWMYSQWLCKAKETVLFLNYYASILFLMVMSVDRYIAVCHTFSDAMQKLRKRTSSFIVAICIWGLALLMCIPVMLYSFKSGSAPRCSCSYEFPDETNNTQTCLDEGFDDPTECLKLTNGTVHVPGEPHCRIVAPPNILEILSKWREYGIYSGSASGSGSGSGSGWSGSGSGGGNEPGFTIHAACHYWAKPTGWTAFLSFNFAVMFLLPLIVMLLCYGLIIYRLSASMVMTNTPTASFSHVNGGSTRKKSSSRSEKDRRRVTVMCATLVGAFVVCWLPFHSVHLAKIAGIRSDDGKLCRSLSIVGTLLAYLNSALNPYLYSLLGTNFSRRWRSATNTFRRSIRRSSSSSGIGASRIVKKKRRRESSSSTTATAITRILKGGNKSQAGNETKKKNEISGSNSDTQHLNSSTVTPRSNEGISKGSPPPDYEEFLASTNK